LLTISIDGLSNEVHDQTVKDRQFSLVQDNTRPSSFI
jgi:hypothetical protein